MSPTKFNDHRDDAPDLLSARGAARKRTILADALRAADSRRRKRIALRVAAGAACAVVLALGAVLLIPPSSREHRNIVVQPAPVPTTQARRATTIPDASPRPLIAIRPPPVRATQPVVRVEIIRAVPSKRSWDVLNDEQFLAALADAGKPSGLARLNGETIIIPMR